MVIKETKRPNRRIKSIMRYSEYLIVLAAIIFGGIIGAIVYSIFLPEKTITRTEYVEVPVAKSELVTVNEVYYYDVPLSKALQRYITEICADKNVPVTLIYAIIERESRFNQETISDTNDYGLMQINQINVERMKSEYHSADLLDPYQNVYCGISIIADYIDEYESVNKALMAYNMGDYGAKKAWENGINSTEYTKDIIEMAERYEEEMNVK